MRFRRGIRRTLIEHHDDIGAERTLHLHRLLRPHKDPVAVHRGPEGHALFGDLAQAVEALRPGRFPRIGQYRTDPVHELMQRTEPADDLDSRSQHEVEGIAEDEICAPLSRTSSGVNALTVPGVTDRHECRSVHDTTLEKQAAATRPPVNAIEYKVHQLRRIVMRHHVR